MEEYSSYIISIFIGIGLAAATGFRVFMPLFFVSLASYFQWLPLQESWSWLGSTTAIIVLGIAMVIEILAYYIPFVDNLLDSISIPLAAIAGTFLFTTQFSESNDIVRWGLGIIAGGGTAATISTALSGIRATSSVGTAGTANPIVSTVENIGAGFMSVFSIFIPILAVIIAVIIGFLGFKYTRKIAKKLKGNPTT